MRIRIILILLGAIALACAGDQPTRVKPSTGLVPDEYREATSQAEKIGLLIFRYDRAAWVATDRLFARFPDARSGLRGWLSEPTNSGWLIYYVGLHREREVYAYRVELSQSFEPIEVSEYSALEFLSSEHLDRYRARQLAISSTGLLCSTNYNPVVLPAQSVGAPGWLVYLLAASTISGEQYLGHHRVLVDEAGTTILRNEALSKTCVRTPPPPKDAAGAFVTHLISDTPIDIHVYRNLVTEIPLHVAAGGNLWTVTAGRITFHGPLE